MAKPFETINSKILFQNPYWNYKLDEYKLPSGNKCDYYYVDSRGSTIIIPQIDENHFILTSQFRYLNQKESLEFPGGGVSEGLSYEENAKKELEEETGFLTDELIPVGEFNPFNGVTNEICKVYLARKLKRVNQKLDETESIDIHFFSFDEINNLIKSNKIWDGMSISSWMLYLFKFIKSF